MLDCMLEYFKKGESLLNVRENVEFGKSITTT